MAPVFNKDPQQHKHSSYPSIKNRTCVNTGKEPFSPLAQKTEQLHNLSLDSPLTFIQSANTSLIAQAQMISTDKIDTSTILPAANNLKAI